MRERGDLTDFTGAGDDGATATESVAACICHALRRLYGISIIAFGSRGGCNRLTTQPRANRYPVGAPNARLRIFGRSLTPNRPSSDQIEDSPRRIHPRR